MHIKKQMGTLPHVLSTDETGRLNAPRSEDAVVNTLAITHPHTPPG